MGEGDLRYVAHLPARPAQVHPDPHVEDGAVAVAEHADGVEPVDEDAVLCEQKKDIKTVVSLSLSQNVWSLSKRDVWPMSRRQTQTHHDSMIITST